MKREVLRDNINNTLESFLDSQGVKKVYLALMIIAVLYFAAGVMMSDLGQGIIIAIAR